MSKIALFGYDIFGNPVTRKDMGPLAQKFIFPPFSVLDARSGEWQARKQAWLNIGIKSEIGREKSMTYNIPVSKYENMDEYYSEEAQKYNTSIFDPVLCELIYTWFCPPWGQIVDPFAGGSVRGIVASLLGYKYWGCDLSAEQIKANNVQAVEILNGEERSIWIVGDSLNELENAPVADLIFSCPPYGDLERYSDDPRDLSTMEYHTFIATLKRIILRCAKILKSNGYACFVIGDFRDKRTGNYRGFIADTINGFRENGFSLYNEAILMKPISSASMRADRQFGSNKKLVKVHQNVLIFRKNA
jgi:DNA modification methylase